ncbi:hypothetical protein [Streptomyces sp. NPDC001933]|uniref:hypothetical protein n=1 Tax=Streptomyces sp. NPDC001933 TaxID=3364626 RepID=UPI00367480DF
MSRSDLLRLFLCRDHAIQEEILEDVLTHTLRLSPASLAVEVADGVVPLSGTVTRQSLVPWSCVCAGASTGSWTWHRLDYEQDDLSDSVHPDTRQQKKVWRTDARASSSPTRNSPVRGRPS